MKLSQTRSLSLMATWVVGVILLAGFVALGAMAAPDIPQCTAEVDLPYTMVAMENKLPDETIVADVDGDGWSDVVYVGMDGGSGELVGYVAWHRFNNESGAFDSQRLAFTHAGSIVKDVAAADCDGDGDKDLVVVVEDGKSIAWLENIDGRGAFAAPRSAASGVTVGTHLAAADVDGDGDVDVVVATGDALYAMVNTDGAGKFGPLTAISSSLSSITALVVADLDNDGDADLATASDGDNTIAWHRNSGTGSYAKVVVSSAAAAAKAVVAVDINGDTHVDLASASQNDNKIAWYANSGAGLFGGEQIVSTGIQLATKLAATDVDGDGLPDLVAAASQALTRRVVWFRNTGAGFAGETPLEPGLEPQAMVAFDCDGDGDGDVVTVKASPGELTVHLNDDGAGSAWTNRVLTMWSQRKQAIVVADLDADGDLDLAVASDAGTALLWHENTGTGAFSEARLISTSSALAASLAVADFDGDGGADVAVAFKADMKVAWHRNMDGRGNFSTELVVQSGLVQPVWIAAGDIDGDTDVDLVMASTAATVVWFNNTDGNGAWSAANVIASATVSNAVYLGDMDGNGAADVVVAGLPLFWMPGLGSGGFSAMRELDSDTETSGAALGDVDSDGDVDVVAMPVSGIWIAVYENLGAGLFGSRLVIASANSPVAVVLGDINDDGYIDVMTTRVDDVVVHFGSSSGLQHFTSPQTLGSAQDGPGALVVGDLSGDGRLDVVVGSRNDMRIVVYRNMETRRKPIMGPGYTSGADVLVAADFDNDGDLDVAEGGYNMPLVWRPNIDGLASFGQGRQVEGTSNVEVLAVGDVNQDGSADIVAGFAFPTRQVGWYDNVDGLGGFSSINVVTGAGAVGHDPVSLVIGDVNADGYVDVVLTTAGGGQVVWLANSGAAGGLWPMQVVMASAPLVGDAVVSDFDGDGIVDVAAAVRGTGLVEWFVNNGTGLLSGRPPAATMDQVQFLHADDVDGDNDVDLVCSSLSAVAWLENSDGAGSFVTHVVSAPLSPISDMAVGDVDGDGRIDIVTGDDTGLVFYMGSPVPDVFVANVQRYDTSFVSLLAADVDGDLAKEVMATGVSGGVSALRLASRTALVKFRPRTLSGSDGTSTCATAPFSLSCLSARVRGASKCVTDTIVLAPGRYSCSSTGHAMLTRSVLISGPAQGDVHFECEGGVLFDVAPPGALELANMTISGLGTVNSLATGAPGLRVVGAGARLVLREVEIRDAESRRELTSVATYAGLGGALLVLDGGVVEGHNVTMARCSAFDAGGAVYASGAGSRISLVASRIVNSFAGWRAAGWHSPTEQGWSWSDVS
ncbi:fibronectin type III domain-containing protein [Thecamonas trahens ATCC 50062]|uniref:Fibronectin type III domain-containing protein n=1 Tax=Thecamonas trahens ATCC 50062 TaxID=461836 RepID=A0A0L0DJN7_THETB|nr:fibronectin type III domain-containing protein [Thecamonas trahens ATCC 50062]KNC52624.1 fibronectin type III domain-containing protein [Thecamonas trahens ATCC 50062]|eukprot:XP_013755180.1 fibronectin type III domain-containing protein [Thecamonas trahens ATCC 50062]